MRPHTSVHREVSIPDNYVTVMKETCYSDFELLVERLFGERCFINKNGVCIQMAGINVVKTTKDNRRVDLR